MGNKGSGINKLVIIFIIVALVFIGSRGSNETETIEISPPLTLGSTIKLNNFTIVFNSYTIEKNDNQFADIKEAIVFSTTITNTSDETQDMLFGISTTCFAPNGREAGDISQIYQNDKFPCYWHDELRSKAVIETYLVCDYSVDGEYVIEISSFFGDWSSVKITDNLNLINFVMPNYAKFDIS